MVRKTKEIRRSEPSKPEGGSIPYQVFVEYGLMRYGLSCGALVANYEALKRQGISNE